VAERLTPRDPMANYYLNEALFELADGPLVDKTVHGLEAKLASGKTLGVLVHRRPVEGGKGVRELVDENVALNEKRLSAFAVLDEAEASVGGLPGILVRTRWRHEGTIFYQLQAHVAFAGNLLIFAVSGPIAEQAVCDATFDSLLQTLTWRTD
jgi:hypothetical protein